MEKTDAKVLGTRLHNAREYLSLTQAQVANILGLSKNIVNRIEMGLSKLSSKELPDFSKIYTNELIHKDNYNNLIPANKNKMKNKIN